MKTSFLLLNTTAGAYWMKVETIVRIEASSNYCRVYFNSGKTLVVARVLKWFEQNLPAQQFMRIHRSHLVNQQFLLSNQFIKNGFLLMNGEFIQLSRRRKKNVLSRLQVLN
jgi:two-component system LytT family response regulator